jgi:hypothetical protein
VLAIAPQEATDAVGAIMRLRAFVEEVDRRELDDEDRGGLLFSCSSQLINCGSRVGDRSAIQLGRALAEKALAAATPGSPHAYECQYSIANSMLEECDLDWPETGEDRTAWEPPLVALRLAQRETLRDARALLFAISEAEGAHSRTRSAACCNLANDLDSSGRWAEAYNFYLRALEIRSDNGNAAGNLAQLLGYRIASGIGPTGHLAAVYDYYVTLAKSLREGTTGFAGADVTEFWDNLDLTGSMGHFAHGPVDGDDYQQWVAQYRLALSPVVEGLGTDDPRWDTAAIQTLYGNSGDPTQPAIISEMNVLKADFLVSRRLAFEGATSIENHDLAQPESDPGYYIDTLDYSLYGTQYSMLLLAQRSTLDVLDKTAVVANDHFASGMTPHKVSFRTFWTDQPGQIRPSLIKGPGRAFPALALTELAIDMSNDGMYAASQAMRNAGTHRIVHAALLEATGVTQESRSSIDVYELLDSTVLALQVTRSAYLYLIDLVAMWNHPDDHPGVYVPLPTFEYSPRNTDTADPDNLEPDHS